MSHMDHVALELAVYLLKRLKEQVKSVSNAYTITLMTGSFPISLPQSTRICVGISGTPGSGKTTISARIQFHVNRLYKSSHPEEAQNSVGIVVPLDGWHFPRSTLDTFPDPKLAYDRRGAHWTFDEGGGYVSFVERLRRDPKAMLDNSGIVTAPSFSHSLKDPVMDDIIVHPHHRIVIIEGLYVFLNIEPWIKAGRTLDERWFMRVDLVQGKERLCKRHVETGVAGSWEEAVWRAENNDIPNGKFIEANMLPPTREILNIEDHDLEQGSRTDDI